MRRILILAPHADDESLGCGGTLLRHLGEGDEVHWALVTSLEQGTEYSSTWVSEREAEISEVAAAYGFHSTIRMNFPDAQLDTLPMNSLVDAIRKAVVATAATDIYLPFEEDAHSDHRIVFAAAIAATKAFRCPTLRRWLAYETPSETDFGLNAARRVFAPNTFVDISKYFERKLEVLRLFRSEIHNHPFPRSLQGVRARAIIHGAAAGCQFAEAYVVLKSLR